MSGWTTPKKSRRQTQLTAAAGAVAALVLLIVPLFGDYVIWLTANMLILALFAVAFNLLFSFTGLLSFGQAAFLTCGRAGRTGFMYAQCFVVAASLGQRAPVTAIHRAAHGRARPGSGATKRQSKYARIRFPPSSI
jgi:hypothetical protein